MISFDCNCYVALPRGAVAQSAVSVYCFSLVWGEGVCVWSLFCYAVLGVLSSFALILMRKRGIVALF